MTYNNRILLLFRLLLYEVTTLHLGNARALGVFSRLCFHVPNEPQLQLQWVNPCLSYRHALRF
jgi:hypothetical protein